MLSEAMTLDLVSECRWKRTSRTEPGAEWEMFRAPGDEEEPTLGGVTKGKSGSTIEQNKIIWKHGGHSIDDLERSCFHGLVGTKA